MKPTRRGPRIQYRFGIGEWYGQSFVELGEAERREFGELQFADDENLEIPDCPFLSKHGETIRCWKRGGVCTLRSYQRDPATRLIQLDERASTFRAICPSRFEQNDDIYRWISDVVFRGVEATPLGQVPFLERVPLIGGPQDDAAAALKEVGRIDNILIVPDTRPLQWCAVEIQAVYFSGANMDSHFREILEVEDDRLVFPAANRRLDYRSSAPKRLMPQLQIKVPTLRRWGKKMAVVVDEDFFKAMGRMQTVPHLSNADVAWFIVRFVERDGAVHIERGEVVFTELEAACNGLIAGKPPTQERFEEKILERLADVDA